MSAQPDKKFACPQLDRLRANVAEVDATIARASGFAQVAKSAREEADIAGKRFAQSLSDQDAVEFLRLRDVAADQESLARVAASDLAARRKATLDVPANYALVADGYAAKSAELRALLSTARVALGDLLRAEAVRGGSDPTQAAAIQRVRSAISHVENVLREADVSQNAARSRIDWIARGRPVLAGCVYHERSVEAFMRLLAGALPEVPGVSAPIATLDIVDDDGVAVTVPTAPALLECAPVEQPAMTFESEPALEDTDENKEDDDEP